MTLVPSSSHPSSGGGGFTVGSSLIAASSTQTAQASGSVNVLPLTLNWAGVPLQNSAGSDLSIDPMDNTHILVATTGWYQASLYANIVPDVAAQTVTEIVAFIGDLAGDFPSPGILQPGLLGTLDGTAIQVTWMPVKIPAGGLIYWEFGATLSNPAGTYSSSAPILGQIMRLA